jgi:putative acetyltransferase
VIELREGGLDHPAVIALLEEHFAGMLASSPAGSCHFLDLSGLRGPDITFWTAWEGDALLGCGALKQLDPEHGEIKSMRTASGHLRRGVAAALLERIMESARTRGYRRLSLETGSGEAFDAAQRLYRLFGFTECPPFADYRPDPFSRFMSRPL